MAKKKTQQNKTGIKPNKADVLPPETGAETLIEQKQAAADLANTIAPVSVAKQKPTVKQVLGIIGNVAKYVLLGLLVLIVVGNLVTLYKQKAKQEQVPTFLGTASLEVASWSMEPTIKKGDVIIISHRNSYKANDIVTFLDYTGVVVTHRIVAVNSDGTYITKGDNNQSEDTFYLSNSNIYGKVVITLPQFSKVLDFFQSIYGLILLILIGFMLIELPYIIEYAKEQKEKKTIKNKINNLEKANSGKAVYAVKKKKRRH